MFRNKVHLDNKTSFIIDNLDFKGLYTPINQVYYQKVIIYGNYADITQYKKIRLSYKNPARSFVRKNENPRTDRSLQRTKENIYRLVCANTYANRPKKPVFATLTFKGNVTHIPTAYTHYRNFINRLNYHLSIKLKYVCVPELQKRGAVHFHIVFFNLPFINKHDFESIWSHGYTNLQVAKKTGATASYLVKYLSKDLLSKEFTGKRIVLTSRNLIRPVIDFHSRYLDHLTKNAIIETLQVYENKDLIKKTIIYDYN